MVVNNIIFKEQYWFDFCKYKKPLPFDFYLPMHNICIEYDGKQHFKPWSYSSDKSEENMLKNLKEIQFRDNIKTKFCLSNNIQLIRIPYYDINKIDSILSVYLLNV